MSRAQHCLPGCLIALCLLLIAPVAHCGSKVLNLLGRSRADGYSVHLSEEDWSWLREKGTLVLGTSGPDSAPMDIATSGKEYEGLTADVSGLLASLLHVQIEVRRYDSRAQVIEALKSGEIDLLGSANRYEDEDPMLVLSHGYAEDQVSLTTRTDDSSSLPGDLEGKRIAMLYHYLPEETVRALYPKASIRLYPSSLSAMGAVAFGHADVYLGDTISANYSINNNYLNNVQVSDVSELQAGSFAFALARHNQRLLRIVNRALSAIPNTEYMAILRRWNAGELRPILNQKVMLDEAERRWIADHPRLTVAFNATAMPLAFLDERGEFRGLSADVLAKISLRTGLRFDVVEGGTSEELVERVKTGKIDILAAFVPTQERSQQLYFSRPYFVNPFVMVSRDAPGSPETLDEMAGRKIAVQRASALVQYLTLCHPQVQLVQADSALDALGLLAQGKVDAAANSLINTRYQINRHFRDRLKVTSTIGTLPASVSLATNRGALELHSILEKALLSISPQEMDKLTNRWRNEVLVEDSYWRRYKNKILQMLVLAALLLMMAATWITYLRRLINKRKQAELALSEQLSFMRVMLDGTPHPIYVRDKDGRLVDCNTAYLDVVREDKAQVLGKVITANTTVDPVDSRKHEVEFKEVIAQGLPRIRDRQVRMADGSTLTLYHWMLPYRDSSAQVIGMIGGWIDISERQDLLNQLQRAKNAADESNRAKTTFLATMSHEIRTPLNAVIGMLELSMKKADQGVVDYPAIEVAHDSAKGLLELIGDILDIARIESGKLSLNPESTSLRNLVESLVRVFEGLAIQKGLQLSLYMDPRADRQLMMDPLRLKQILSNLLSNAIKFTASGEITLSVEVGEASAEDQLALHILVQDSGIGISPEDQLRLFNPFEQASNHAQSARGGSGLGLSICKTLCDMMGGELHLNSALGRGTQVEIFLEFPVVQEPLAASGLPTEPLAITVQPLRVLVIDDHDTNRLLLSKQLGYLGHEVLEAVDGAAGLHLWREHPVDVVITDCNMPIMNGYKLTQAIRTEEAADKRTPCRIFGYTANAQPEEQIKCREAGMDDCLFKPLSLQTLQARLRSNEAPPQPANAIADADKQTLDISGLLLMTGGDFALAQELLGDLARSTRTDRQQLQELRRRTDCHALLHLTHRIKGGARIIKHGGLIAACEAVEAACAQETDTTRPMAELDQALVDLMKDLQAYGIKGE